VKCRAERKRKKKTVALERKNRRRGDAQDKGDGQTGWWAGPKSGTPKQRDKPGAKKSKKKMGNRKKGKGCVTRPENARERFSSEGSGEREEKRGKRVA